MKKVLLIAYGAGHVNMVAQVLRRLREDRRVEPVALALSVAKHTYAALGLPHKTVLDYRDRVMDEAAERYGRLLADRWHVASSGLTREESVVYLGASMRDLANEAGEAEAFCRIEAAGRQAFLPRWTMGQIIAAERPDLILTTNAPRMERAATLMGNAKGIPTINLHDDLGFIPRNYLLSADRIAVMSEITVENLIAQGHAAERIVITGQPAFDPLVSELARFRREEIVGRLGLPGEGPYLLLGTSQPGARGEIMEMCPITIEAVKTLPRYHLIIKPHPGEDGDAYREYVRLHGGATVVTGVGIRELLFVSELLISFASTIIIESILMGKPVISLNLTGQPDPIPFVKWGLVSEARSDAELTQAIRSVLEVAGARAGFLEARQRYFGTMVDGQAARRVAEHVYAMVGAT